MSQDPCHLMYEYISEIHATLGDADEEAAAERIHGRPPSPEEGRSGGMAAIGEPWNFSSGSAMWRPTGICELYAHYRMTAATAAGAEHRTAGGRGR
uniref:Uncharacterized protein n=1 Tax=Aegilops tauschii subsp. strangulata TaxID=200361 RepID=A0A453DPV4_AEGTS